MDSLTKILQKIESDNKADCEAVLKNAEAEAKKIVKDAESKAEKLTADILTEGERLAENYVTRQNSSAELNYKRRLLSARVEITESTLNAALEALSELPKDEYFATLICLAERYAERGDAVLKLTDEDYARKPEDFAEKVNSAIGDRGEITVSGGASLKKGGFLLCYAETVINCGFEALLDDVKDDAKYMLGKILFE